MFFFPVFGNSEHNIPIVDFPTKIQVPKFLKLKFLVFCVNHLCILYPKCTICLYLSDFTGSRSLVKDHMKAAFMQLN